MIELIATCLIASGIIFSVPEGWQAVEVGAQGSRDICNGTSCYAIVVHPIPQTYAKIKRTIKAGDTVELPKGCSTAAVAK